MKNISLHMMRLAITLFVVFSVSTTVYALGEYTPLSPLPGTTLKDDPTKTNFETYLPGLFNWAIGVAAVMAFVMITAGGITYMTADSIGGTTRGRGMIENAIWGLVLVAGAYVILYTINPAILNFRLDLQTPFITTEGTVVTVTCPTCQPLGSNFNITSRGKTITPAMKVKLEALNTFLSGARVGWRVTEAFPPAINHGEGCHAIGTCIDANIAVANPANIKAFLDAAKKANLNATYEVKTDAELAALVRAGIPSITCSAGGGVCKNPQATAAHFHVK